MCKKYLSLAFELICKVYKNVSNKNINYYFNLWNCKHYYKEGHLSKSPNCSDQQLVHKWVTEFVLSCVAVDGTFGTYHQ